MEAPIIQSQQIPEKKDYSKFKPTIRTFYSFLIILLLVFASSLLTLPLGSMMNGSSATMIFGLPNTFLKTDLMDFSQTQIIYSGLILDIILYLIISYIIDLILGFIFNFFKRFEKKPEEKPQVSN